MVTVILLIVLGYLVHGVLLGGDYARPGVANLYRSPGEQARHFPLILSAQIVAGIAIVWLFRRIKDDNSSVLWQGARFGVVLGALMVIPKFLFYFAVQPLPADIAAKQIVFDTIAAVVIGIVVSVLNSRSQGADRPSTIR